MQACIEFIFAVARDMAINLSLRVLGAESSCFPASFVDLRCVRDPPIGVDGRAARTHLMGDLLGTLLAVRIVNLVPIHLASEPLMVTALLSIC